MATLDDVIEVLNLLKSADSTFSDESIPDKFAKWGVIQASAPLEKSWSVNMVTRQITGDDMSDKEIYLAGLFAYRFYALKKHDELTEKAVNFKTINFAVTGLTERAKEGMRIVWWCDGEIIKVLNNLGIVLMGAVTEMKEE